MKKPNNRICGSSETIYYKHKDGGVYEVLGYCDTYVDGVTLNLIAYKQKGGVTRYVRTVEHFHNSFKGIKPEYEYQWLAKNRASGEYCNRLIFYGDFETEQNASERFKKKVLRW